MTTKYYVANRVREERKASKLRQEDLARLVGVSRQTIIAIEGGRLTKPSIATCLMLGRVLNQPVEYLFYLVPLRSAEGEREEQAEQEGASVSRSGSAREEVRAREAGTEGNTASPVVDHKETGDDKPHAILDFGV